MPKHDVPADVIPPEGLVGPIYLFTATDAGEPFPVSQHGRAILHDRGVIVQEYLFDTLGDHAPGGTGLTFEITKVAGRTPGLDVASATSPAGSPADRRPTLRPAGA